MERNDYDRVANAAQDALITLLGNTQGPLVATDSVTVTKDGWISAVAKMQRAIDYSRGLAEAHWRYASACEVEQSVDSNVELEWQDEVTQ